MPRPGDYGVTPGGGLPMLAVRLWTGQVPLLRPAWAGHAALVSEVEGTGRIRIIEATPDQGVRERWLRPDELSRWRWSAEPLTDKQRTTLVAGARSVVGRPYDWPSVMEVGVRVLIARYRGHAADHPDKRLFCSELVAWLYRDFIGYDLFPGFAPGTISPHALDRRRAGPLTRQPGPDA
jgi:uncharacterized protein YycO